VEWRCIWVVDCCGLYILFLLAGGAMNNLAWTYSDLGRHEDALAIGNSALQLYRCVLPADHLDIGKGHGWNSVACWVLIVAGCAC